MDEYERAVEPAEPAEPVQQFADLGEDTGWNLSDDLVAESDRDA